MRLPQEIIIKKKSIQVMLNHGLQCRLERGAKGDLTIKGK